MRYVLIFALLSTGCTTIRRHPAASALVAGAAVGTGVALATRQNCKTTYDGKPYGTLPEVKNYE